MEKHGDIHNTHTHTHTVEIFNNIIKCYTLFVHMDSKINCPILLTFDIVFICIYLDI